MQAIDEALYTLFTTDATLMALVEGVYNTATPANADEDVTVAYPMLIFQQVSGLDDYTLGRRVRTAYLYQFRVLGTGLDMEPLNDAAERVEALLMDTEVVAGTTLYCRRESQMPSMAEMDAGVMYQQVGATYRIEVHG
ncbi:MAG: hypothetical protein ABFE07_13415 [Armatimonadia bacterium]